METPKQMAEEYAKWLIDKTKTIRDIADVERPALQVAFLAGYQAAKPQWISVKERLPEDHNYYFVSSKNQPFSTSLGFFPAGFFWDIDIAYFHKKNEAWMTGEIALNCKDENKVSFVVSYWMPLPELPKGEE